MRRKTLPISIDDSVAERFYAKVKVSSSGCWEWQAFRDPEGYGRLQVAGKNLVAHRVSFTMFNGPIKEGLVLDHLCRNRGCVNPAHLRECTDGENVTANGSKAFSRSNLEKTECPKGHPYDARNTYRYDGRRFCRACLAAKKQRQRERKAGIS